MGNTASSGNADLSAFYYPNLGIQVPNAIPFYPIVTGYGEDARVKFNQGYIINFQDIDGDGLAKIPVDNVGKEWEVLDKKFFIKIKTNEQSSAIQTAEILDKADEQFGQDFHYSSLVEEADGAYTKAKGIFMVPLCEFDDKGGLKHLYLRDNILWQKTNYSCGDGSGYGLVYSWGDSPDVFGSNPLVRFRKIAAREPLHIEVKEDGKTLEIYLDPQTGTGSSTGSSHSGETGKTAIVPFRDEFIGWESMEAPEPWFFDIVEVEILGAETIVELSAETVESCEEGSLQVISIQGTDRPIKATASINGTELKIRSHNFFFNPKKATVFLYGVRKGFSGRHKRYTQEQYLANNAFYGKAHENCF